MRAQPPPPAPVSVRLALAVGFVTCLVACTGTVGNHHDVTGGPGSGGNSDPSGASGSIGTTGAGGSTGTTGVAGSTGVGSVTGGAGAGTPAGSAGTSGTVTPPPTFACNPSARPPEATLRRLTMTQFKNTISDLVAWASGSAANGRTILTEIATPFAALPADRREAVAQDLHGSYRRLDQSLQQAHVDATYDVAVAVGAALTTSARLGTVVGACATDSNTSNDAGCLDAFIKKFGARALRRPLTADEVTFYTAAYGASTAANAASYADLIGVFVTAPEFMYFVEHGGAAVTGQTNVYDVTAYELASRLSYQVWQTAPDDALLAAAADGSLLNASTYAAQVTRLLGDARARPAIDEFFADWMKVEDLPAMDAKNQDPVFKTFAGADLPTASLRQAMIDDVIGLLDYAAWTKPSGVAELFTSELSFARDARLAKLYGVAAWDGTSAPPALPPGQRPGLLTRGLFLSTGTANTRPIMKGVFIRKNILCHDIPPPPPGANAKPPTLGPGMTTRESVEELTEMAGTTCAGCHATVINPLGFATENFDALGRFRTAQRLFDDTGRETGSKPVDTSTVPMVRLGDTTRISTPAELMTLIATSGQVEACLARNFFRFTYGRWEDPAADGCALEDARKALANGGKLTDLFTAMLMSAEFKRRSF
jgi:hypothetical protein